jgi:hypothetical protein
VPGPKHYPSQQQRIRDKQLLYRILRRTRRRMHSSRGKWWHCRLYVGMNKNFSRRYRPVAQYHGLRLNLAEAS